MNNLMQSNIVQLCSIMVSDLFAITMASKIRNNKPLNDWTNFNEMAISHVKKQLALSLVPPKSIKLQKEMELFTESHTERLAKNLVNIFLLGIADYGEHFSNL